MDGLKRELVLHYTVGLRIEAIVKDGRIRPAATLVGPEERKIVWFSTNPI